LIITVTRECGFLPSLLLFQELWERNYRRSYGGMKRFIRRHFTTPTNPLIKPGKPKAYSNGEYPGARVQVDVKYVPKKTYMEKNSTSILSSMSILDGVIVKSMRSIPNTLLSSSFVMLSGKLPLASLKFKQIMGMSSLMPFLVKKRSSYLTLSSFSMTMVLVIAAFVSVLPNTMAVSSVNTGLIC